MAKGTQINIEQIKSTGQDANLVPVSDGLGGVAWQAYSGESSGGGAGTSLQVDQSGGTSDTHGVLAGEINGSNTTFTVSKGKYSSGNLTVYLNGQLQTQGTGEDWVETTPGSGTFDFNVAPEIGDIITVIYSIAGSASFVYNETPSGDVDGVNTEFTLANTPADGTEMLYRNGLLQKKTTDYTISGDTIDFVTSPLIGSILLCTYQLDVEASGNADTVDGYHETDFVRVDYACQGRLTLETGVPISTSDQADKTTLYFTPYKGNLIYVYDGSSDWVRFYFTELSLDISAFTASKPYDIFVYDNSGTLTLEGLVWTDGTTRATALVFQDGVYVKSGATTRRYLGTIYIDSGQKCQDTLNKRYVWNLYNQEPRVLYVDSTSSHSYSTASYRAWNNDSNNAVFLIIGLSTLISCNLGTYMKGGTTAYNQLTEMNGDTLSLWVRTDLTTGLMIGQSMANILSPGYRNIQLQEYASGSCTFSQYRMSFSYIG